MISEREEMVQIFKLGVIFFLSGLVMLLFMMDFFQTNIPYHEQFLTKLINFSEALGVFWIVYSIVGSVVGGTIFILSGTSLISGEVR